MGFGLSGGGKKKTSVTNQSVGTVQQAETVDNQTSVGVATGNNSPVSITTTDHGAVKGSLDFARDSANRVFDIAQGSAGEAAELSRRSLAAIDSTTNKAFQLLHNAEKSETEQALDTTRFSITAIAAAVALVFSIKYWKGN